MKLIIFYLTTIAIGLAAFMGINSHGLNLFGHDSLASAGGAQSHMGAIGNVLLALVVIIAMARVMGAFFKWINQPPVMGEVIGGIFLGPSLLGKFFPGLALFLIPPSSLPYLNIVAQIGIVLYMFLVGLELDLEELKKSRHSTFIISHTSILFPFLLGSLLALFIFESMGSPAVGFTNFALFMGVSMSVTAFPVLARILADKAMTKTSMGSLALTCAAIDDVTAWCLLALVVSRAQSALDSALYTYFFTALFILGMLFLARPFIIRWLDQLKFPIVLILILLSALTTEAIGIHAIFGAFLLGVIIPHNSSIARELDFKMQDIVRVLFLPAFFAYTGMKTQIGLLSTTSDWVWCGVIIIVATVGKFGGTFVSAKLLKHSWKESITLGILMNTRGLVELIVLNIGLELGIISPRLFTMLVIMAVVTTFMTGPLLSLVERKYISA